MRALRFAFFPTVKFCLCLGILLWSVAASAQLSTVAPRVKGAVDDSSRVTLKGGISGLARAEFDQGAAPVSTEMTVRVLFSRTAEQQAALDTLIAEQINPSSPNYHKWLTPQQFGQKFGPADSDIAAVSAWLESQGLKVGEVPPGRSHLRVSGTVAQLQTAFRTSIHFFSDGQRQFLANVSSPQVPAALAPVISGIARLNTIQPSPQHVKGSLGQLDPGSKRLVPAKSPNTPELTTSGPSLYVVPADAATIYNTPNALNGNFSSGTSYTGQGVTIGIGGDATIQGAVVVDYRSRFLSGDSTAPTISYCNTAATITCFSSSAGLNIGTADKDEAYIDNELAGGLAPGASIHYYASSDLFSAVEKAISDDQVDIFSLSFGECELQLGVDNSFISTLWSQAATQGIVITVSTGDSGSAGCDFNNPPNHPETAALYGLQVNGLASTPYNLAIGGTDFYPLETSFGTYVTNSNGTNYRSALGYIPEDTWNASTTTNSTYSKNVPTGTTDNNLVAGSGGVSNCSKNDNSGNVSGCTGGYSKPTWQKGTSVPSDGVRDIPDVSLLASNGVHGATWLVCTDDTGNVTGVGTVTADCTKQSDNNFYFLGFGGTSTSAPAFAGILALVQQKVGSRLGVSAAKNLYDIYNGSSSSTVFHDTVQGNISVVCATGSPNCSANSVGNLFLTGYDTGIGYDLATGLGSVDATALINNWTSGTGTATSTVTVAATPVSPTTVQDISVAVTVSGASSTPTGTVTVTETTSGYTSSATQLASGAATVTIQHGVLNAGSYTLTATYSGDSTYATSNGTTSITVVAAPTPTVSVTPSSNSLTTVQPLTVSGTVTGSLGTPRGTVTLSSGSYTSTAQTLSNGAYSFTVPAGSLAIGSDTLTVTYSGDTTYGSTTGTASVTVTGLTPTETLAASSTQIFVGQSLTVTATMTGSGNTPTGTVSLSGGGYSSGSKALSSGAYTFTIPASSLSLGTDTLTVTYSGDNFYSGTSQAVSVTVLAAPVATVTVSPASTSLVSSKALDVAITVTGNVATPTGTVTLSGGGYTGTATSLTSGSVTVTIPANTLTVGSDTLTATYNGDSTFSGASGTSSITVTAPYSMATTTPSAVTRGTAATSTLTLTADPSYTGTVTLTCASTSSTTGVTDPPTCAVSPSSITITAGTPSGTATVTISSTAAQASLQPQGLPTWTGAGGGAVLALLVFCGIPARRRTWRNLVGLVVLMVALGSLSACGSSSTGGGATKDPGTTAGSYSFKITGTGNPAVTPAPTATVTATIN